MNFLVAIQWNRSGTVGYRIDGQPNEFAGRWSVLTTFCAPGVLKSVVLSSNAKIQGCGIMKILFASETPWMDGVVFDLHVLAESLVLLGHEVHAIDPGRYADGASDVRSVSRVFPDAKVALTSPRFPHWKRLSTERHPILNVLYKAYRRYRILDRLLAQARPDLVVLYSAGRIGLQTSYLARRRRIPVVFRNVDKLYNLWPTFLIRKAAEFVEKRLYRNLDLVLALTPKYAEYLIRCGADPRKTDLLLFPIDTEQFSPEIDGTVIRRRWGLEDEDQVIVFIGTLYEFGGIADLVREFPKIREQVPRAKFLIVGDGPLRPTLERVIAEMHLDKHVIVTGYQPFSDMPRYVNAATLCVNCFPINEVTEDIFSAKIVQYLACGKATVSSAMPGITTLLDSARTGVVYAETVEAVAKEIVGLLKSPERRAALERIGRSYAVEAHDRKTIARQLEQKLLALLAARGAQNGSGA